MKRRNFIKNSGFAVGSTILVSGLLSISGQADAAVANTHVCTTYLANGTGVLEPGSIRCVPDGGGLPASQGAGQSQWMC